MIIIRETFTARPGQASKLAKLFKKAFGQDKTTRVLTDLIGEYNTVVVEREVASLTEFEKQMQEYQQGKGMTMDPETAAELSRYTEMYTEGRREVFKIVE